MSEISTELIKEAVYNLCFEANTCLDEKVYKKIAEIYCNGCVSDREKYASIIENAKIAYEKKLPLCQDTGMVTIFLEIGQEVKLKGEYIEDAVNSAVEKCYKENFFRKSIVKNAVFDRTNTDTNTPVVIHTKIIKGEDLNLKVLIKGAGSENKTKLSMMLPTSSEEEIIKTCADMILSSGESSCPPLFVGIGIGSSADNALVMSKEALIDENFTSEEVILSDKIKNYVNLKAPEKYSKNYVIDLKIKTSAVHIASMPVAVTINCHSKRVSQCKITKSGIEYFHKPPEFIKTDDEQTQIKEVFSNDIETIRNLKKGEKVLLSGEMYVARDMAHKRLIELIEKNEPLPIEIKDKIIFYAGPCPAPDGQIIGSIGPTTAGRMDKYAVKLYEMGLLATIGKGERSEAVKKIMKEKNAKYFTMTGGIAALISQKIKKCEIIAFKDLQTEAIYKISVKKIQLLTEI